MASHYLNQWWPRSHNMLCIHTHCFIAIFAVKWQAATSAKPFCWPKHTEPSSPDAYINGILWYATYEQFHTKCWRFQSVICIRKLHISQGSMSKGRENLVQWRVIEFLVYWIDYWRCIYSTWLLEIFVMLAKSLYSWNICMIFLESKSLHFNSIFSESFSCVFDCNWLNSVSSNRLALNRQQSMAFNYDNVPVHGHTLKSWIHQWTSHYLNQYWSGVTSPYRVIRPEWVKCTK